MRCGSSITVHETILRIPCRRRSSSWRSGSALVKVTNPDKVFFSRARRDEARPRPVLPRGRGRDRARALRAADPAQAPPGRGRGRGDLPEARPGAAPRLDRDRAGHLPLGPARRRALRHRARAGGLGREPRHARLPPLAVAPARRRASRRAPHRHRPAARHDLRGGEARRGASCRRCSTSSASSAGRRRRATAASTSPAGSSRTGAVHARCAAARSRSRARSSGARPSSSRPRGGRRSAASRSSSTTTRTRATGRSPRRYSVRARPDATVSAPVTLGRAARASRPRTSRSRRCRRASPSSATCTRGSTTPCATCAKLLEWVEREERGGRRRGAVPAELPEDARRAEARPALAREEATRTRSGADLRGLIRIVPSTANLDRVAIRRRCRSRSPCSAEAQVRDRRPACEATRRQSRTSSASAPWEPSAADSIGFVPGCDEVMTPSAPWQVLRRATGQRRAGDDARAYSSEAAVLMTRPPARS